jgi:serine/threonine protein kinase/tetratricopeptide (TPR) repeat protein
VNDRALTIGPYDVEGLLGQGGMGVVYAGRHRVSGVRAAIKTVHDVKALGLGVIRREVLALGRLGHPGVVRILEQGLDEQSPWYAMELLEGNTLSDVLDRYWARPRTGADGSSSAAGGPGTARDVTSATLVTGELPGTFAASTPSDGVVSAMSNRAHAGSPRISGTDRSDALGLVRRLCEVLSYIHGEGIIHCDIKPDNIFVTPQRLPVLVDFGLVSRGGGKAGREVLDSTGRIAGSVKYMAPEQIRGELLDPRCDLYALGCVLYELLTGTPPFTGDQDAIINAHLVVEPAPVSTLVEGVPPELDRLVSGLLAKDRRERIGYADVVGTTLAGMGVPSAAWDVEPPRTHTYVYRPPLIGRQKSIEQAETRLVRPAEGAGGVVFVGGESGVGKTRLAMELARRARGLRLNVVTGSCMAVSAEGADDEGDDGTWGDSGAGAAGERFRGGVRGAPLHPLRPLLRSVADRCVEQGAEGQERLLGAHGALLAPFESALGRVVAGSGGEVPVPLPADAARKRLFAALAATLAAYSRATPTLMVIDDLQWADELTLSFLAALGEGGLDDVPLVVVGTYRSEEMGEALAALTGAAWSLDLVLDRLEGEQVGAMVAGMLALPSPPKAFVNFLARRSEGNPLFVTEYLRMAVAEQVLVRNPWGQWSIADTTEPTEVLCEALPLPRSLREVVERRLEGLSVDARRLLACAAVLGRQFEMDVLQDATSMEESALFLALNELTARHIIEPTDAGNGLRFAHDKLREIPYREIPEVERRVLHSDVAEVLEGRIEDGEDPERLYSILAHHWSKAGSPARAAPHFHRAADQAFASHALDQAIEFYRAALRELGEAGGGDGAPGAEAGALNEKLGDSLALIGHHEKAQAAFKAAVAALGRDDGVIVARILRKSGKVWETRHDHEQALAAYARAEAKLDEVGESAAGDWRKEWIQVQLNRIWVYYWQARIEDMNELVSRVGSHVDQHGSALQRSNYHQALVTRDYRQHRYVVSAETLEHGRLSLRAAEEAGAPVETAFARFVYGFGLLFAGRLQSAEAELYEALLATRRLGDVTSEIRCLAYLALTYRRSGRADRCGETARELLELATPLGMMDYIGVGQACLGWTLWKQNDLAAAKELCEDALESWGKLSFAYPFQWAAGLTLLAAQLTQAPLLTLVGVARKLLEDGLSRLPEPIDAALKKAVQAHADGDPETTREALGRAVGAARDLGYN